ncbi:MAG: hypothetical protein AABX66_02605 [Nanoarchaeota archaeon]
MSISKLYEFYKEANSSFKIFILAIVFVILVIISNMLKLTASTSMFWMLVLTYIAIISFFLPETSQELGKVILSLLLILLTIVIVFAWLKQGNIPFTNIKADNNAIIALFTIILAIATIINIMIYKQSIGFSRLSELDFELNNILCVEIRNIGNYPARGIKLSTKIIDKIKSKGWQKRRFKDLFLSPEYTKHYLPSKGHYAEKLREYLEKRFELDYDKVKEKHTSKVIKFFKVRLELNYYSDNFFKNPIPIIKEYEVKIDSNGMTKEEVKPKVD